MAMCASGSKPTRLSSSSSSNNQGCRRFAGEDFDVPTLSDINCIENRQLEHSANIFFVGKRCKYGFPQAFGFHPVEHKVSSGLFRLSCPLLVKAIDEWEGEGGVREMSDAARSSAEITADFEETNRRIAQIRRSIIDSFPGGMEKVQMHLGEDNSERYLSSGIAGLGLNAGLADVKCLHAHVADHLCRKDGGNRIGQEVLRRLADKRGVNVCGNENCWQQCDVNHNRGPSDWHYLPRKNRQKLKATRRRRKDMDKDLKR
uniref:DUF501 domain-containing protein n=1 Tax=Helicotheca tamesis TaxID=374047 RepID=A0A7S2HF12_9STRA|eukprot:CAMPEP_0185739492 /NCGR_PEP_ID=MMETSP1171-20130828/35560_1 /TAXON_ID=374046 /ORGANISM="Helicotheca tamensis, Strain CCMP826" /LENGTH=258 /DNA_ID=CAMNT_0028411077 /DNA_START=69 /DNA_END=845 /DNA_ORIENTATION=+